MRVCGRGLQRCDFGKLLTSLFSVGTGVMRYHIPGSVGELSVRIAIHIIRRPATRLVLTRKLLHVDLFWENGGRDVGFEVLMRDFVAIAGDLSNVDYPVGSFYVFVCVCKRVFKWGVLSISMTFYNG